MTLRHCPTAIESDDSVVLQYESLRSQVLNEQEIFTERSLGLTLFIRQGMVAWIEACQRYLPAHSSRQKRPQSQVFVYETTSEMIKVMANITLLNLEEALA